MNRLLVCLLIAVGSSVVLGEIYLSTCARMNTPILKKAARAACITSCSLQDEVLASAPVVLTVETFHLKI
ncbi:unnamed protein product [Heligmosomoides polygyrus]|uniref:DAN domain-containing protein n=1 Tax=Heligmosomoides polygyrus TaxID=6339 RepID=A0A183FYH5_HELPZ|nr:unnamed protein product [Heligmosomoides polygyrus]